MIKEILEKKTEDKKQSCRQLQWQIELLKGKIEAAKRGQENTMHRDSKEV